MGAKPTFCRYEIVRWDLDAPPKAVDVPAGTAGVALDVRRGPRPVGFVMAAAQGGSVLPAEAVAKLIEAGVPAGDRLQPVAGPAPKGPAPSTTIVVCTKDHPDLLERCLTALAALERHPADPPFDLLVVDNAPSDDASRRVAERFAGVRYVREPLVGLNFARNRALAEAQGEILAFIDDDAVVDPAWASGLRQAWAHKPDAGAYTGQTLPLELETEAQVVIERMGGFRKGFQPAVYGETSETDWLYPCTTVFGNGCNMAFRVSVMRALGGFDEALDMGRPLPGGGDLDALHRVVRAGHGLVYEPQMLVWHQHRRGYAALRRQIRRSWGAGCMAYLTKIRDQDPGLKVKAQHMIRWWIKDLALRVGGLRPVGDQPWDLVVQELVGALTGLTGTYERARRRARAIRQAAERS
jgi:GT2 family glycosyltransferase